MRMVQRRRDLWQWRPRRDDSGLTLIELVVVLAVVSIVMTLSLLLIVNVNQQTTDMLDTVQGVQSATGADLTFVQYLRGSTELLPVFNSGGTQIAPSATELDTVVNDGFCGSSACSGNWGQTQTYQSNCTNFDALWTVPTSPANADAKFEVSSDIPATGLPNLAPWNTVALNGTGPYKFAPNSPCAPASGTSIRQVSSYYALATQSLTTSPIFTYYGWSTTNPTTTSTTVATPNVPPGLVQLALQPSGGGGPAVIPVCALTKVAAVEIHVTFLAGPQTPKEGFAADQPTTLNTIVYLIGNSTSGATTSTTTTSTTAVCPD